MENQAKKQKKIHGIEAGRYIGGCMSYSLNTFKGVIWDSISGTTMKTIMGNTRSLDPLTLKP